jgi:hypothetical protein
MTLEQQAVTASAKIIDFAVTGLLDWRLWFIHVATWAALAKLKHFWWNIKPRAKRARFTELVAGLIAAVLTAKVYYGDPWMTEMIIAMALINPYVYKIVVGFFEWKYPQLVKGLKFKEQNGDPK